MLSDFEFWVQASATAAVVVLIPLYLGFVHVGPGGAAAYAAAGGVAMTVGEHLQYRLRRLDLADLLLDAALWGAAIAGIGGLAYLLALLFI